MKTLNKITSAFALCVGTMSYADTTTFQMSGTETTLTDGCVFVEVYDGTISYNDTTYIWATTSPATVKVRARNITSLSVTTDNAVRDSIGIVDTPLDLDLSGSSVVTQNARNTGTISGTVSNSAYTVGGSGLSDGNTLDLTIYNDAQGTSDFVPVNLVTYYINHTVTCTQ